MKRVEIITLRCLSKAEMQFVDEFLDFVRRQKGSGFPTSIKVYHHSTIETDLSIHLHWEMEMQPSFESPLGQQISYALKKFGLLNHSVWVEVWNLE